MNDVPLQRICGALLLLFAAGALEPIGRPRAQAAKVAFTQLSIPEDYQGKTLQLDAWLSTPPGSGPFAAVILAHGCNGVRPDVETSAWPNMNAWAAWLNQQGYAALVLDSFTARGIRGICIDQGADVARELGRQIPTDVRALDIYMAADFLAKMPKIGPRAFGVVGFSHGGGTVLRAAAQENAAAAAGSAALASDHGRLAAFVAMYPGCRESIRSTFRGPVLIFIGTSDHRASADNCQRLADHPRAASSPVTLKLYPGATHSFDVEQPDRATKLGDTLRFSAEATADARTHIREFLAATLTAQ